ncbi:putative ribonuclease H-like domain-containing protein, partial [Tanacetum coccineum]
MMPMAEIDIRWQAALITGKAEGSHFARECRFAKYQENRANGHNEKRIVAIEDSNSKALVATDNNEDIDWTKEFDAEPMDLMILTRATKSDVAPVSLSLDGYKHSEGIDELAIRNKVVDQEKTKSSQSAIDRNKVIIEDWVIVMMKRLMFRKSKGTAYNSENSRNIILRKQCLIHLINDAIYMKEPSNTPKRHKPKEQQGSRETRPVRYNKTPHKPQGHLRDTEDPRKMLKQTRVKKGSTVGSQAVLPQTVKKSAMINPKQTWKPKGNYLDSVNRGNPEEEHRLCYHRQWMPLIKVMQCGGSQVNLLSVSQISDNKHNILSQDKECLILSSKSSSLLLKIWQQRIKLPMAQKTRHVNFKRYQTSRLKAIWLWFTSKRYQCLETLISGHEKGKTARGHLAKIEKGLSENLLKCSWELYLDLFHSEYKQEKVPARWSLMTACKFSWVFFYGATRMKPSYMLPEMIVAERKNRTLIEAARTMLADSLLPIQFWAEAVNTACYVLNRVLVTKPQMKTPYEILMGRSPNISFMRPFGCPLTILNTLDQLGKFDGKSEEGYLLGYSTSSKGFRVYNRVTRKVQDCLHVDFLENQENQKGKGPDWMFDLELLTPSMNYIPVRKENYADSGGKVSTYDDVEDLDDQQFIVHGPSINAAQNKHSEERTADKEVPLSSEEQALHDELVSLMHQESIAKVHNDAQRNAFEKEKRRIALEKGKESATSTLTRSTANTPSQSTGNTPTDSDDDVPKDGVFSTNSFDDENTDTEEDGAPDYNNMDHTIDVSSTPTLRIHKNHPQSQIIGKSTAGVLTRRKLKESASDQHQALLSFIYKQNRTNHKDQQTCLFACFLSQEEPKKVSQALADESWVEAMQEELLQFKLQDVWVLCDLPDGKRVIGTKWVFRNKRDERGTIIKNKARLVAQGYRQEEGVDYDEV